MIWMKCVSFFFVSKLFFVVSKWNEKIWTDELQIPWVELQIPVESGFRPMDLHFNTKLVWILTYNQANKVFMKWNEKSEMKWKNLKYDIKWKNIFPKTLKKSKLLFRFINNFCAFVSYQNNISRKFPLRNSPSTKTTFTK